MKAEADWKPSKFAFDGERLSVGPDVGAGTWLITRLVAEAYDRALRLHAHGRLVDLGCGTVPLYEAYRPFVSSITCVDWGESRHGARYRDFDCDLNEPLPFADASFDTAILSDVLEHVHAPAELLREIRRILAPGGRLLLNVPFLYWLHEQPYDYFRYTEHALRMLVERAGLLVVELQGLGGAPHVLADVAGKHLQLLPGVGAPVVRTFQRAVFAATRLEPVQRALAPSRQRFPLCYFLVAEAPSP
ncbi:MAG TPA: class I SAM-dependent methyltransferase [Polyangiaceae bacterium]|nr:class I SAM-dependent methyltransferase [Polyangiaceae bacterium]